VSGCRSDVRHRLSCLRVQLTLYNALRGTGPHLGLRGLSGLGSAITSLTRSFSSAARLDHPSGDLAVPLPSAAQCRCCGDTVRARRLQPLHRDWARARHICTGTGPAPPTSADRPILAPDSTALSSALRCTIDTAGRARAAAGEGDSLHCRTAAHAPRPVGISMRESTADRIESIRQ
jgi:hypothetical protein